MHRRSSRIWAALAVILVIGACSSGVPPSDPTSVSAANLDPSPVQAGTSPIPPSTRAPTQTAPPPQVAAVPDGVYRVHLTVDELVAGGSAPENAGTFTLTIKGGSYRLSCIPEPPTNCGNTVAATSFAVEVGSVNGTGPTVWFVPDNAEKSRLTGCVQHSHSAAGCGPEGAYRLDWRRIGDRLAFSGFYGIEDQADGQSGYENFTFKPWTKIA